MKNYLYFFILLFFMPTILHAEPVLTIDKLTKTATVSGLDEVLDGCELHQGLLTLTGIQYSDSGNTINLLRFNNSDDETFAMPTGFDALSKQDKEKAQQIIKEGMKYFVRFSVCGSGGFMKLIEINLTF